MSRPNKPTHHLLSGATSGFASAVLLQPLDLVKTRLQQGSVASESVARGSAAAGGANAREGAGGKGKERIGGLVRRIVREEGVGVLWRGTGPTVVRNVPGVAVYFYLLNEIRYTLSTTGYFAAPPSTPSEPTLAVATFPAPSPATALVSPSSTEPSLLHPISPPTTAEQAARTMSALPKLSLQGNLVAGAVARTSVGFVLNPFTVLKSRYESNLYPTYTSLPRALTTLIRTEGLRGLFQGFTATAARDAPYAGIYVVFYEEMKEVLGGLAARLAPGMPTTGVHTLSGISAATLATLATSPADCIKTKMQLLPGENPTIRKAVGTIFRSRGLPGFFAGSTLRISRKAASSAIGWSVYEGLLLGLRDRKVLG